MEGTGRCLCGQIRYRFGAVAWCAHCHCDSCRRATSSPMTSFFGVPRDKFTLLSGKPALFQSSPGVDRWFCPDCGSPIAYDAEADQANIHLYVASADRPADFTPQKHVFVGKKLPWLTLDDHLPQFAGSSTPE